MCPLNEDCLRVSPKQELTGLLGAEGKAEKVREPGSLWNH